MEIICTIAVLIICFPFQQQNETNNLCVCERACSSSQPNLPWVLSEIEEKKRCKLCVVFIFLSILEKAVYKARDRTGVKLTKLQKRRSSPHPALRAPLQGVKDPSLCPFSVWYTLLQQRRACIAPRGFWSLPSASSKRPIPVSGFRALSFVNKS